MPALIACWPAASCFCAPPPPPSPPLYCSEADPPEALPALVCAFPSLRHLSLSYPIPGAVPPRADLPAELSGLTRLSTLQLKWVPAQQAPAWLGVLAQLQHLYYDPYLHADAPGGWRGWGWVGGSAGGAA